MDARFTPFQAGWPVCAFLCCCFLFNSLSVNASLSEHPFVTQEECVEESTSNNFFEGAEPFTVLFPMEVFPFIILDVTGINNTFEGCSDGGTVNPSYLGDGMSATMTVTTFLSIGGTITNVGGAPCATPTAILYTDNEIMNLGCPEVLRFQRTYNPEGLAPGCTPSVTGNPLVITVEDTTEPAFSITNTITIEGCDASAISPTSNVTATFPPSAYSMFNFSVTDICTAAPTVTFIDGAPSGTCPTEVIRTYTAEDACGNINTITQTILITDTQDPTVTCPNANVALSGCDESVIGMSVNHPPFSDVTSPAATLTVVEFENIDPGVSAVTDNCVDLTIEYVDAISNPGNCPLEVGRTFTITDGCGNHVVCTQTFTISDDDDPVITATSNTIPIIGCSIQDVSPTVSTGGVTQTIPIDMLVSMSGVTATDNCASLTVFYTDMVDVTDCPIMVTRTFTAIDLCGNAVTATQMINVDDPDAPTLVATTETTIIGCSLSDVTAGLSSGTTTVVDITDMVLLNVLGISQITDACPNPTLSYTDQIVSTDCPYMVDRIFTAEDQCGNQQMVTQSITVQDIQAPTLSCTTTVILFEGCASSTIMPPVSVSPTTATTTVALANIEIEDLCPTLTITYSDVEITTDDIYRVERTYEVIDACLNMATCSVTLSVTDTNPPTLLVATQTVLIDDGCGLDDVATLYPAVATNTTGMVHDADFMMFGLTVEDECGTPTSVSYMDVEIETGPCTYEIDRTYTATDNNGNVTTATQTITVTDTEAPSMSISSMTITIEGCTPMDFAPTMTSALSPTLTLPPSMYDMVSLDLEDNCTATVFYSDQAVSSTCPFSIERVFTAIDLCGNTDVVTQTVIIQDTKAPTFSCSSTISIAGCDENDLSMNNIPAYSPSVTLLVPGQYMMAGISNVSDNCTNTTIEYSDEVGGTCPTTVTRTFIIEDNCGNTDSCVQTIEIDDDGSPTITTPPADQLNIEGCDTDAISSTLSLSENTATTITIADFLAEGGLAEDLCGFQTITYQDEVSLNTCPQTVTRTFILEDFCMNTSTTSQTFIIDDDTNPVFSITSTMNMINLQGCDQNDITPALSISPATNTISMIQLMDVGVSVTDACGIVTNTLVYSDVVTPGSCTSTVVRTYDVADECGNMNSISQTFIISDTQAPTITSMPSNLTLDECDDSVLALPLNDSSTPVEITSTVILSMIQLDAVDACGTPTYEYQDQVTNTANCRLEISRLFIVSDNCGNQDFSIQNIIIEDVSSPTLTASPTIMIEGCDLSVIEPPVTSTVSMIPLSQLSNFGATATDACGMVTATYQDVVATSTCVQTVTRTFMAVDACGNMSTTSTTITIQDTTAPTLTINQSIAIEDCDLSGVTLTVLPSGVTQTIPTSMMSLADAGISDAEDACTLTLFYEDKAVTNSCPYQVERMFTAIDACGNATTRTQMITVEDTVTPTLMVANPATLNGCDLSAVTSTTTLPPVLDPGMIGMISMSDQSNAMITSTDACTLTVTYEDNIVSSACPIMVERMITAMDDCGNMVTETQMITIADANAPEITSTTTMLTFSGCDIGAISPSISTTNTVVLTESQLTSVMITVSDDCTNPTVTYQDMVTGTLPPPGIEQYVRTFTATDACGNMDTYSYLIQLEDDVDPVIAVTPTMLLLSGCGAEAISPSVAPAGSQYPVLINEADWAMIGITATDLCGTPTVTYSDVEQVTNTCPYTVLRTFEATDVNGNISIVTQTIEVRDMNAPTVTCPTSMMTIQGCGSGGLSPAYAPGGATMTVAAFEALSGSPSVMDNCVTPTISYIDVPNTNITCPTVFEVVRTYTIEDLCGNTSTCSQTLTVEDNDAPMISNFINSRVILGCSEMDVHPPVSTMSATMTVADFETTAGMVTETCGTINIEYQDIIGIPTGNQFYILTRNYTISDACGNEVTDNQIISVEDNTPPSISCTPTITYEACDASVISPPVSTSTIAMAPADAVTATDNCQGLTVTYQDVEVSATCPQIVSYIRTYTVTDVGNNTATCTQAITVEDTTSPTLVAPPFISIIGCGENAISPTVSTNPVAITVAQFEDSFFGNSEEVADACGIASLTYQDQVSATNTCPTRATVTRTFIATDHCQNSSTISVLYIVSDFSAPTITCPGSIAIEGCNSDAVSPSFSLTPQPISLADFQALGGDAFGPCVTPTISYSDINTSFSCPVVSSIIRTYVVEDDCGNTASCTQSITVEDNLAPTLVCPPTATVVCDLDEFPDYSFNGFLSAGGVIDDACGIDIGSFRLLSEVDDGMNPPRSYTRVYEISDLCMNVATCSQIIEVTDVQGPTITCPPPITASCELIGNTPYTNYAAFSTAGGSATDNCEVDLTSFSFIGESTPTGTCPITSVRTYEIADVFGNTSQCTQAVIIDDTTPPTITCPSNLTATCTIPAAYLTTAEFIAAGGTVMENCSVTPTLSMMETATTSTCPQFITRTYTFTDGCGNTSSCDQLITLDDQVPPTITCPNATVATCDITEVPPFTWTTFVADGGMAMDDCLLVTSSLTLESETSDGNTCPEIITRVYSIADACGNTASCSQDIVINDFMSPTITCPSVTIMVDCDPDIEAPPYADYAAFLAAGGSASDNCAIATETFTLEGTSEIGTCPRTVTRIYSIADACGNTSSCMQTLIVSDDTPPTLTCPTTTTVSCAISEAPTYTWSTFIADGGMAMDNCGVITSTFTLESSTTSTNTCPQTITRVYSVEDLCGNSGTCAHTIIVWDQTAPTITCPPDLTVSCGLSDAPAITNTVAFMSAGGILDDNCSINTASLTRISDVSLGGIPEVFERTYQISDLCGNTSSCTQLITIEDTTPPSINCPSDISGVCNLPPAYSTLSAFQAAGGVVSDVCGLNTNTFTNISESTNGGCPEVITREYYIEDLSGNSATCTQSITVFDPNPLTVVCPTTTTVCQIGDSPTFLNYAQFVAAGGSASGLCGPDISSFRFVSQTTDNNICPETVTRIYEIADPCGRLVQCTQTIIVDDITNPTLICPNDIDIDCLANPPAPYTSFTEFQANGGGVLEDCDIDPSTFALLSEEVSGPITDCPRTVTRTYVIEDNCGNTGSCVQLIVSACPTNLAVTDNPAEGFYNAAENIQTSGDVEVRTSATFQAANMITLNPGFETGPTDTAPTGTFIQFEIILDGCQE